MPSQKQGMPWSWGNWLLEPDRDKSGDFWKPRGHVVLLKAPQCFCHKAINSEKLTEKEEKNGNTMSHPLLQIVHNNKPQAVKHPLQLALLLSQTAACIKTFGLNSAGFAPLSVCHLTHVLWQVVLGWRHKCTMSSGTRCCKCHKIGFTAVSMICQYWS